MSIVIWLVAAQSLVKYFSTVTENIHMYVCGNAHERARSQEKIPCIYYLYQCLYDHEAWWQNSEAWHNPIITYFAPTIVFSRHDLIFFSLFFSELIWWHEYIMRRIWNVPAAPSVNKLMNSPAVKCSWILGIQDNSLSQITRQIPQLPVQ